MDRMERTFVLVVGVLALCASVNTQSFFPAEARWCVVNDREMVKCQALVEATRRHTMLGRTTMIGLKTYNYTMLPVVKCVRGVDLFNCMERIYYNEADLVQLETGLSYTGGEFYNMMPLVAEKYVPGSGDEGLSYYAVAVVRRDNPSVNFDTLKGKSACFPGVGRAAGWIYPISTLMELERMEIVECNVPVKSAAGFFSGMCAPDALARYYNPFGNNPASVCKNCIGYLEEFCTCNDPYAGFPGAFNCMANGKGDVTFVRNTTVLEFVQNTNTTMVESDFELLCIDGTRAPYDQAERCNWGKIASHVIMTSMTRDADLRDQYKTLLMKLSMDFGDFGSSTDVFRIFDSTTYGDQDVMFSDETVMFKDVNDVAGGTRSTYYTWAGAELHRRLIVLNKCPIQEARWCVISDYEMQKCEDMIMAFSAKDLKPDLNCVRGYSVQDCMMKIQTGDADLITLDAADVYIAGKDFQLVPIAAEDYGGTELSAYYAVAVARRRDSFLTLFNMKQRRTCHGGVMTAAGWITAIDKLIVTAQIEVNNCDVYLSVGQYFSKSCVPGVLSDYYNPYHTNPINLCEACGTHGPKRCVRNDEEQYYGSSGAFRCVTEMGGDVGFVRHTTVRENTDGRNQADWARNRRSDDYELLCIEGIRKDIDEWRDCNLGRLPANAVVTAAFKSQKVRDIFWTLMNFAQQFYDDDLNPDFPMFDSTVNHKDLMFQDATVRLVRIAPVNQTYSAYLGPTFMRAMQRMTTNDCVSGRGQSAAIRTASTPPSLAMLLSICTAILAVWTGRLSV